MNEDAHLEATYEQQIIGIDYGFVDENHEELCEECDELIEDCSCCPDCNRADCEWNCEQED